MNLELLLKDYANDPRCFTITDRITASHPRSFQLSGLHGSSAPFVVTSVFNHPASIQLNHLVILRDAEEAAYFHNTLENLTQPPDLFYFPSSFKNKKNFRLLNSSHTMLRIEALTKIAGGGNRKILVTYPEALAEKVVKASLLTANIIAVKQSDTLDLNAILSNLVNNGFERTDFVYQPGQFALRGGILDIYSFGNEKPYRIELFGNEVDSIRIFDPESQLSERKLLQVNIIPNLVSWQAGNETNSGNGEKVSLLEYLPENTVVWTEDWTYIREKIEQLETEFEAWSQQLGLISQPLTDEDNPNETTKTTASDFVKLPVLEDQLSQHHIIEFTKKAYFSNQPGSAANGQSIPFNTKEQPAFNRNFDLLISNLKDYEAAKYKIYLFAENPKQLERLHVIFRARRVRG